MKIKIKFSWNFEKKYFLDYIFIGFTTWTYLFILLVGFAPKTVESHCTIMVVGTILFSFALANFVIVPTMMNAEKEEDLSDFCRRLGLSKR